MDSDDTIHETNGRGLRSLARGHHGDKTLEPERRPRRRDRDKNLIIVALR